MALPDIRLEGMSGVISLPASSAVFLFFTNSMSIFSLFNSEHKVVIQSKKGKVPLAHCYGHFGT